MKSSKIIINTIMALIAIIGAIVLFDIGKTCQNLKSDFDKSQDMIDSLKSNMDKSIERTLAADSIYLVELGKIRQDLVELSKLREITLRESRELQDQLTREYQRRDSLKSLLEW